MILWLQELPVTPINSQELPVNALVQALFVWSGEVTSVTGLDLDVSITLDLCHNRIYINFHPLMVIFDGFSALISTEWWMIFYLFIYLSTKKEKKLTF